MGNGGSRRGTRAVLSGALAGCLATGGLAATATPAAAENVVAVSTTTDSHTPGSLRSAIDTADTDGDATTIELPAGTYPLDLCGTADDDNTAGDLDHTAAEPLTIVGLGAGATIEQTCAGERVLDELGGGLLTLTNVTVTGGDLVVPDHADAEGGGVRAAGDVTLTDASISGNTATGGATSDATDPGEARGGGLASAGTVSASGGTIGANVALGGSVVDEYSAASGGGHAAGGGIHASGVVTLTNTTVSGNRAEGGLGVAAPYSIPSNGGDGRGGGVHAPAGLAMTGASVTGNEAVGGLYGGAASGGGADAGTTTATDTEVSGNTATGGATTGGDYIPCSSLPGPVHGGGLAVTGDLTVDGGHIDTNTLTGAAGGYSVEYCFEGNGAGATARGGGAYASGIVTATGTTFDANSAVAGAGGYGQTTNYPATFYGRAGGGAFGGAVSAATLHLDGVTASGNQAVGGEAHLNCSASGSGVSGCGTTAGGGAFGAGFHADGGASTVTGSTLDGNTATGGSSVWAVPAGPAGGGGLHSDGDLTIDTSTLIDNVATGGAGFTDTSWPFGGPAAGGAGSGGGVDAHIMTVTDSTIANNQALGGATNGGTAGSAAGGGIDATDASVSGALLSGNVARGGDAQAGLATTTGGTGQGGGVHATAVASTATTSMVFNVADGGTVVGGGTPGSGRGGAIGAGGVSVATSNLSGNQARAATTGAPNRASGGAVFSTGLVTVTNSTLGSNRAGALGSYGSTVDPGQGAMVTASTAQLRFSTVTNANATTALNAANTYLTGTVIAYPTAGAACSAPVAGATYSQVQDGSCAMAGTGTLNNASDPLLAAQANNGGPTNTRLPADTSPLVDAIPPGSCTVATDQRGEARPTGVGCEIGSVEVPSTLGAIAGTVVEDGTGTPVAGVTVRLYSGTTLLAQTTTDGSGSYLFVGLDPGTDYRVRFLPAAPLVEEFHTDAPSIHAATHVTVAANTTTVLADGLANTTLPATIDGTVTEDGTGTPVAGVTVRLYSGTAT